MKNKASRKKKFLNAVVANSKGEIFDLEGWAAVGMDGSVLVPLTVNETQKIPHGSEFMLLPDRIPVLYHIETGRFETIRENPYVPAEPVFPVAAFNSPGYMITHNTAFAEKKAAGFLPLFSYGAVGWHNNGFRSAIIQVDGEKRQDLRYMKREKVVAGIRKMRKAMPLNRLRKHLETCALTYGCPAGKNFFLRRFEAPLPTSRTCNARCIGCISLQSEKNIRSCQDRIDFTPTPEEIAQVALTHIRQVKKAVVSFGQGCEGEPLLAGRAIEPAIRAIRSGTSSGTINLNTNGSLPETIDRLIHSGLDSIRISLNSVRKPCYEAYYRPVNYRFEDVLESIRIAAKNRIFISLNYLNCPGFTDTQDEYEALSDFLNQHPIQMIQWRNLNIDPFFYLKTMEKASPSRNPFGMAKLYQRIKNENPELRHGYFNPPKS